MSNGDPMAETNNNFDFSDIIEQSEKVREIVTPKEKPKRKKDFIEIEITDDDSPLKAAIVERINKRKITYAEVCDYCVRISDGDKKKGQTLGYNIINCLKNSNSMNDSKFTMWCDFLNLDVLLVDRKQLESSDDSE